VTTGPVGVGIIGAGMISDFYLENLTQFPDTNVLAIADIDLDRAKDAVEKWNVPSAGTTEDLLADPDIEIVLNLTIPAAHASVSTSALEAGKHVWSEKPITVDRDSARALGDRSNWNDQAADPCGASCGHRIPGGGAHPLLGSQRIRAGWSGANSAQLRHCAVPPRRLRNQRQRRDHDPPRSQQIRRHDPHRSPAAKVERPPIEQEWETVESVGPEAGRGLGVLDMARHIRAGGLHIATGELGLHVLDTLIAVEESATRGEFVTIQSTVPPVPSLPEEFDPFQATL
jgi:Oxidoreductase family, NAD-binding Rossmann fold